MGSEEVDILIIGAGLSGICAGYYAQEQAGSSYTILEARDSLGGTWDLFRYPGIRSDSDMHTLGFEFHPWPDPKAIADGPSILAYLHETAETYGIDERITYDRRVSRVEWSSDAQRWTATAVDSSGKDHRYSAQFVWFCTGYYRYDRGHMPDFPGAEDFEGTLVHPQFWTEDIDYAGRNVVVIGSGATAVTLVPSMAERASHVTMLQRSPSYVMSLESDDTLSRWFTKLLGRKLGSAATRWKNVIRFILFYQYSRRLPGSARRFIMKGVRDAIGDVVDVDTHFSPDYDPWDQRVCFVPDDDLFDALRDGSASVVTDQIVQFVDDGIELESGEHLPADIIVSATGLEVVIAGGAEVVVDGEPIRAGNETMYKGAMLSNVPNAFMSVGYTNAAWTLKCELISQYVVRMIDYMRAQGHTSFTPRLPDDAVDDVPLIDFNSGYILRALDDLPNQGEELPWRLYQNYILDRYLFRRAAVSDDALDFR